MGVLVPDDILSGHPRTLHDHQDWRVRDVKKQNARSQQAAIAATNIKISEVVSVSQFGHVRLAAFTNEEGDGLWFSVLNRCVPQIGQYALYVMVDGNPIVLGTMPTDADSRHLNEPRFFEHLEHFDTLTLDNTSGSIGAYRWLWQNTSGSVALVTGVSDYGFGWVRLATGGTSGNNSIIYQRPNIYAPQRVLEMEFGVGVNHLDIWATFGLSDNLSAFTNGVWIGFDKSSFASMNPSTWSLISANAGVYAVYDTGIPVVAGHRYTLRLANAGNAAWNAEVVDWDTADYSTATVQDVPLNASCYLHASVYDRLTNAVAKSVDIDYVRWRMFDVKHGSLDIRD